MASPLILIFGATGMVGRETYRGLRNRFGGSVLGIARNDSRHIPFSVGDSWGELSAQLPKVPVSLVINCLGVLQHSKETDAVVKEYLRVNGVFPHELAEFADRLGANLIHISSDAVYANRDGEVDELSPTHPDTEYGRSKLIGEPTSATALTIRTSFLGRDNRGKGFLTWAEGADASAVGYTNQRWSGCTTSQFSQLCQWLAEPDHFARVRSATPLLNFAPLGPISKYLLAKVIRELVNKPALKRGRSPSAITRRLGSQYSYLLPKEITKSRLESSLKILYK